MSRDTRLRKLKQKIEVFEEVVQLVAKSLPSPLSYHSGFSHAGFRFGHPGWQHFCLIKSVRAVSGLNACFALLPGGFVQEIAVIVRTIIECTTHLEYVLAGLKDGTLEKAQDDYVKLFFSDFQRNDVTDFKRPNIRQRDVHRSVGLETDHLVRQPDASGKFQNVESARLMSNVYLTFSNYVHGRYPEVMDLYGGSPPHFYLCGMPGTPKDDENLEVVECFAVTVSNALKFLVMRMELSLALLSHPPLTAWFNAGET